MYGRAQWRKSFFAINTNSLFPGSAIDRFYCIAIDKIISYKIVYGCLRFNNTGIHSLANIFKNAIKICQNTPINSILKHFKHCVIFLKYWLTFHYFLRNNWICADRNQLSRYNYIFLYFSPLLKYLTRFQMCITRYKKGQSFHSIIIRLVSELKSLDSLDY